MSQIFKAGVGGTPSVPTSFTEDSGTAVPVSNNLNIVGGSTSTFNPDGITTVGSGDTVTIELTNRFDGTVTTSNATPDTSISLALGATPGVYTFDIQIAGYDVTDAEGVGYAIFGTVTTTGAAASVVGTPDKVINEESAPVDLTSTTVDANLITSGNNAVIELTGIAGKTINWRALATYVFVS